MAGPGRANLVNAEGLGKAYGTRVLLDGVSLGVAVADRIGVVGRNGDGKSTLLRLLARDEPPDRGRVTHRSGLRVGRLRQHDDFDPQQLVLPTALGALADQPEHAWAGQPRVRDVLGVLLGGVDPASPVGRLSGGERRRVALARLLVDDPELLLLDEPTNHLDVEAIDWLTRHLVERGGALVAVTHDRWFLDTVATTTWEVQGDPGAGVAAYDGGYSAYVLAQAERARLAAADESRRQGLVRKELAWLRRGPPARTSKPRFRVEAANALVAGEPPARDSLALHQFAAVRLGRTVVELDDVSVRLGSGPPVLDRVTWNLGPGDRVGVVGANGSGKTTLLRVLAGELAPTGGHVQVGRTVRVAHLSQEVAELDGSWRALEAVERVRRVATLADGREVSAAMLLDRFGFTGDRPWTRVADLSGGERRRLQLLRLLVGEPNVLLLDEPTNDLDVPTLQVLEDLLDGWPGTLVVVSHDRWFLERVTDEIRALPRDGRLVHLPGGVAEYLERVASGWAGAATAGGSGAAAGVASPSTTEPPPAGTAATPAERRAARKELARVERELERLAKREERLHADLAANATDHVRVAALDGELRTLLGGKAALEDRWLQLADVAEPPAAGGSD